MADVHVKGLADLQKFMDQLPARVEANVMRGALRAGMNVVKPVAQSNIHSISGELARGLKVGTKRKGSQVIARLRATGKHAFVAPWVEFGTAAHVIKGKRNGWLSVFGRFFRSVEHPGSRAKPFMRPAMDSMSGAAVVASAEYMKKRLSTKHGLDTADVLIEGDE